MISASLQRSTNEHLPYSDFVGDVIFHFREPEIILKIRQGGYIPKSGVFLARCLNQYDIRGDALDIGTGETGFLAYYLKARGAERVTACDIDEDALEWAKQAGFRKTEINWILSDVFESVEREKKFDLIVSNPPQMPMLTPGNPHDYGGRSGRDIIVEIINGCKGRLKEDGKLVLLCFDFLGVLERFGTLPSLAELIEKEGLSHSVIDQCEREVRKGGKTEDNIEWIKKVYPEYQFRENQQGNLIYKVLVLEVRR
jgi:methylase of polypeptide subunit release factors